jgi:transcriptional regulator with GAF, ATPase, and Fis domain
MSVATELETPGIPGRIQPDSGAMDNDFNRLLASAVRDLDGEPAIATTLERAVAMCTEAIEHCDLAGVTISTARDVRTIAASDDLLHTLDALQLELSEGPSCGELRVEDLVTANDLQHDLRWPAWGPEAVAAAGVCSLLGFRLFATTEALGALTLYARMPAAFTHEDVLEGQTLAAHVSVALAATVKEAQLHRALESRTVIGQATGILIERFGLDADRAFAVMRRVSQNHNIKLHAIAEHLVRTGVLLEAASPEVDLGPEDA